MGREVSPTRGQDKSDAGTHWIITDKATGAQVGIVPKNIAKTEQEKVTGKFTGEQLAAAPGNIETAQETLQILDQLKTHPGMSWGTGMTGPVASRIPGTDAYEFGTLYRQAKATAFREAIKSLKGLGAMSNTEGEQATRSLNRMDNATSEAAFRRALADYEKIVRRGMEKAQRMLAESTGQPLPTTPAAPSASSDNDPLGIR